MKRLVIALALVVGMVGCDADVPKDQPLAINSQFQLGSDQWTHCPKCNGIPASMAYHKPNHEVGECSFSAEGVGNEEHFKAVCGSCGFVGYMSINDGKTSRAAHS
jgi:ribosomal protein S27AE